MQLNELRGAVGSPIATIEDENDVAALEGSESALFARGGGQIEIGRGCADGDAVEVCGCGLRCSDGGQSS